MAEVITEDQKKTFPHLHPLLLQLLINRKIPIEEIDSFFVFDWNKTHDYQLFKEMSTAVARVFKALQQNEKIVVHGDYDADGVCGSALLLSALNEITESLSSKSIIESYIPHRDKEGYGVSVATVEKLYVSGTTLIITVDCGISNRPAFEKAKELGIDVIICDHHTVPEDPPTEVIIIHPGTIGETYPFRHLCGTGVAFKLVVGLFDKAREIGLNFPSGYEKWWLDLVAIATVTDVMPMSGENRLLEHFGLTVLNKTRRPGLLALIKSSGAVLGGITTETVGFQLGPRLNAAGRMVHASHALDLLMSKNAEEARILAQVLEEQNRARQSLCEKMYKEAAQDVIETPKKPTLIAVIHDTWSPGLVGLVAGKLTEKHAMPTIAVGKEGDRYIGSGRSIKGYDITEALQAASKHLDRFGGHPEACGFSTDSKERLLLAIEEMQKQASKALAKLKVKPALEIDSELDFSTITLDFVRKLQALAPFGQGNPSPVFVSRVLLIRRLDVIGKTGSHLKLLLESPRGTIHTAIGFRFGSLIEVLKVGSQVDVVYEIGVNSWKNRQEIQLRLIDITQK